LAQLVLVREPGLEPGLVLVLVQVLVPGLLGHNRQKSGQPGLQLLVELGITFSQFAPPCIRVFIPYQGNYQKNIT